MEKSEGEQVIHDVKMQSLVDKQRHRKSTNRHAGESGINRTLNCVRYPDKGQIRSGYTRRSRNRFKQFSNAIDESGKLLPLQIELQSDHLAVVSRSINQLNNIVIKSTVGISAKHHQNVAWKADNCGRSCTWKPDSKQRLGIGSDRTHMLQGLHAGAPGPPFGQNSSPIQEVIAVMVSPRIGSHIRGISTSANQEDRNQSEGCVRIVLDVIRYAYVTNEAENGDEEQETHQRHTLSPRPIEHHSVPHESAAQLNQVAHVELLNATMPTPALAATEALKSVKRDESDKDSGKKKATQCASVNSNEMEARGPRQRWWIGSATHQCASLYKTFRLCVPEMRFFLQFGSGLRTSAVSHSGEFIHSTLVECTGYSLAHEEREKKRGSLLLFGQCTRHTSHSRLRRMRDYRSAQWR